MGPQPRGALLTVCLTCSHLENSVSLRILQLLILSILVVPRDPIESGLVAAIESRQSQVDPDRLDRVQCFCERHSCCDGIVELAVAKLLRRVKAKPRESLPEAKQVVIKRMGLEPIIEAGVASTCLANLDALMISGIQPVDSRLVSKVDFIALAHFG
jgi:hypothetical protein